MSVFAFVPEAVPEEIDGAARSSSGTLIPNSVVCPHADRLRVPASAAVTESASRRLRPSIMSRGTARVSHKSNWPSDPRGMRSLRLRRGCSGSLDRYMVEAADPGLDAYESLFVSDGDEGDVFDDHAPSREGQRTTPVVGGGHQGFPSAAEQPRALVEHAAGNTGSKGSGATVDHAGAPVNRPPDGVRTEDSRSAADVPEPPDERVTNVPVPEGRKRVLAQKRGGARGAAGKR